MSIAVEFQDVVKRFPNATENAVDHVSFQIQEKEMITILGTSGCGKTTLMKMVTRLYAEDRSGAAAQKNRICDPAGGLVSAHDR